ncbi:MAG TPA: YkgJ family cysteine cluster protein [Candidatus Desulfovibrio intestinigallinarum]|nr:YkgJ family cysteine cluster protein [Candidatus Desulfovibrio intestinigallinarum]
MTMFTCDHCGECCRQIQQCGPRYAWLIDTATGQCRYFDPERNLCRIYALRPLICRVEEGYSFYFSHIPYDQYIEATQAACLALKKLAQRRQTQDCGTAPPGPE